MDLGTTDAGGDVSLSPELVVQFGPDLPDAVRARIEAHLTESATRSILVAEPGAPLPDLHPDSLLIGFGDTTATRTLIEDPEREELDEEGYILRSGMIGGTSAIVVDGRAGEDDIDDGVKFGAYALMESLGFAFLHPLDPLSPPELPAVAPARDRTTAPRWPVRGLQIHTMHPLELTDLLQGWGPDGPQDEKGWQGMLGEWDMVLEWLLANGQNRVHWVWLGAPTWAEFADSEERIERMNILVDRAHEFGLKVGVDVPIRLQQQHAWRLVREEGTLDDETEQIRQRVAYLMQADFDYLATESGSTEFTSVDDRRMVDWMDALTEVVVDGHGKEVWIKVHASTGQTVENFSDPETGEPLNFNFLPHYADERLGVMPHTVQHYALDDQAPTYGNTDFDFMREFLQEEIGRRPVAWHPETAYWVSFDVDVPLFLPVYAKTRLHDLRLIARDEDEGRTGRAEHAGKPMQGQFTFSSGWEWGYWLQEVVTARAAWDPRLDVEDDREALALSLEPATRVFGEVADDVNEILVDAADAQDENMIQGLVAGRYPRDIAKLSGQAYLQGTETWDDVADLAADWLGQEHARTQPDKYGMVEMRGPLFDHDVYDEDIEPLLDEMELRLTNIADRLEALREQVPEHALPLFDDLLASARLTALRATQVRALYDYVDAQERERPQARQEEHLADARQALDRAAELVAEREQAYRVPADRIAGWRDNPTAYPFTYLWTVRSLHYWWRDEGKAVLAPSSPCFMNIINPVSIGFGEGDWSKAADIAADVFQEIDGLGSVTDCLGAPVNEPTYPPPGLR
jgi:hypothetical protein